MMKLLLKLLVIPLILLGCHSAPKDAPGKAAGSSRHPASVADNHFNFKLFNQLLSENLGKPDNFVFSPTSIKVALGMLLLGASNDNEQTEKQIADILGYRGQNGAHVAAIMKDTIESFLSHQSDESFISRMANGAYIHGMEFQPQYQNLVMSKYKAEVKKIPRGNAGAEIVNQLVKKATMDNGKPMISKIIEGSDIEENEFAVLVNALYMRWVWNSRFDKKATRTREFMVEGDKGQYKRVQTKMMSQRGDHYYGRDKNFQYLRMDSKRRHLTSKRKKCTQEDKNCVSDLSIYFVLPRRGTFLAQAANLVSDQELWEGIDEKIRLQTVSPVILPKLNMSGDFGEMLDTLQNLKDSEGNRLDLSGQVRFARFANRDVYVKKVAHKAVVKMDEKGGAAAAATAIVTVTRSLPRFESFVANRPFFYAIKHNPTGEFMFIGYVKDPTL